MQLIDLENTKPFEFPEGKLASELFDREKTPSDFVLPGFLAGTVGALIAPGSTGKSMLAMQLAALVAGVDTLGTNWQEIKFGEVIIMAVEDPMNELYNRWTDLGSRLTVREKEVGAKIRVIPMIGKRFDIMNESHFQALIKLCEGKILLIMDTMRRIHKLDENNGSDMEQVVSRLEEIAAITGCAILFLHHINKAATFSGAGDKQQASRGSSVLVDNIRFQMFLVGMKSGDEFSNEVQPQLYEDFVRLGASKVNYGKKIGDIWLRRTEGGILTNAEFEHKPYFKKIKTFKNKEKSEITKSVSINFDNNNGVVDAKENEPW